MIATQPLRVAVIAAGLGLVDEPVAEVSATPPSGTVGSTPRKAQAMADDESLAPVVPVSTMLASGDAPIRLRKICIRVVLVTSAPICVQPPDEVPPVPAAFIA